MTELIAGLCQALVYQSVQDYKVGILKENLNIGGSVIVNGSINASALDGTIDGDLIDEINADIITGELSGSNIELGGSGIIDDGGLRLDYNIVVEGFTRSSLRTFKIFWTTCSYSHHCESDT